MLEGWGWDFVPFDRDRVTYGSLIALRRCSKNNWASISVYLLSHMDIL